MEGNKIRAVYLAPENSGVALYRFYQPLKNLEDRGLIEVRGCGFDWTNKDLGVPKTEELKELAQWADIFIVGRRDEPMWANMIHVLKEFTGKPILLDIDDDIFSISPYLPAYQAYLPGRPSLALHEETAKYVDGIIVSTPFLKEIYDKFNKNVWIVPNGINGSVPQQSHDGIRLGYFVSHSHLENAQIIETALIRTLKKYSNVRLYYTKAFGGFLEGLPKDLESQSFYVPFFPLKDYLTYCNQLGIDIGLAPLMKNDFNRAKSNIRVLEYWQNGATVIASPLDEYKKTITHGFDGYLSENDEWEHWLDDLIQNPERRKYMAHNAQETLKKYDVTRFADIYLEILKGLTHGKKS